MHICRKWRRIVFSSQRALQVRLLFTHGTPVLKTLDCWPTLPIVVHYGGSPSLQPPTPGDEGNIIVALKHSDRVTSIRLTVTSSLLERLSAIERPFSELEDLVLLSQDSVPLTLPSTFMWGSRLRRLYSTKIAVPELLALLYSSKNLVDLHLHEVLNHFDFLPEVLMNALSGMVQLRSLSLRFLSTPSYRAPPPPYGEHVVLPVLTHFKFRGNTQYLEGLVARVDAPRLGNIEAMFFDGSIFELPEFIVFIGRIEMHNSYRRADILSSERAISISLTQTGIPTCLKFQLFRKSLSEQLSFMARIRILFSAFLFNVEDLRISAERLPRLDGRHNEEWLKLINSFTDVKWLHVSGNLSADVICSLQRPDMQPASALSSLHKLYIPQPGPRYAPLREAVVSFMVTRRLAGYPIVVEYERLRHIGELLGTGTVLDQR